MPINKDIIKYLATHKDTFEKKLLIEELKKANYSQNDIDDSVNEVYKTKITVPVSQAQAGGSFWDFKNKKKYTKPSEKIKDFIFGFLGSIILCFFISECIRIFIGYYNTNPLIYIFSFIGFFILLAFLFNKRKYIAIGMLSILALPLIFFGGCLLLVFGAFGSNNLF